MVVALTLYNGSVLAEIFRAGLQRRAEGPDRGGVRRRHAQDPGDASILLPQAVKIMLPALISQCVVALKDTSLGYYVLAPG